MEQPAPDVDDALLAALYAYARIVSGDDGLAAEALRDVLVMTARRPAAARPAEEADPTPWAWTRNEVLRHLRARLRFVDAAEPLSLAGLSAGGTGEPLWRAGLSGLSPGDRDVLALRAHGVDVATVCGVGGRTARGRLRAAEEAWTSAAGAVSAVVATADEPPPCAEVPRMLGRDAGGDDDGGTLLRPRTVRAVARHVAGCPVCRERRRRDLGAADPGGLLVAPAAVPADLRARASAVLVHDSARADRIAARADAVDAQGRPLPLDADDRAGSVWARRGAGLAVLSAVLLLLGTVALLISR